MNGHVIILQASRKIPDAIAECLRLDGTPAAEVQDVPHAPGQSQPDRKGG